MPYRKRLLILVFSLLPFLSIEADEVDVYNYTGGVQTFTVPAGVTSISVDAYGASGTTTSVRRFPVMLPFESVDTVDVTAWVAIKPSTTTSE